MSFALNGQSLELSKSSNDVYWYQTKFLNPKKMSFSPSNFRR